MTQYVAYFSECSMWAWEKYIFFCHCISSPQMSIISDKYNYCVTLKYFFCFFLLLLVHSLCAHSIFCRCSTGFGYFFLCFSVFTIFDFQIWRASLRYTQAQGFLTQPCPVNKQVHKRYFFISVTEIKFWALTFLFGSLL